MRGCIDRGLELHVSVLHDVCAHAARAETESGTTARAAASSPASADGGHRNHRYSVSLDGVADDAAHRERVLQPLIISS